MRRLVAKVAFKQVLPRAQELPPPSQFGVGTKDAVTHIASAVRCAHDMCVADSSAGILQIDVSNAFNTISRAAILESVWADLFAFAWPFLRSKKKNRPFLEKISEKKNRFYLLPIHCWLCFAWMHI